MTINIVMSDAGMSCAARARFTYAGEPPKNAPKGALHLAGPLAAANPDKPTSYAAWKIFAGDKEIRTRVVHTHTPNRTNQEELLNLAMHFRSCSD
jgi:hypothetical protein